jgi:hypothetical protein
VPRNTIKKKWTYLKSLLSLKKNYKFDLNDKIKRYKIFDKKTKKIKKLKIDVPNQNILYIQIKYKKLN